MFAAIQRRKAFARTVLLSAFFTLTAGHVLADKDKGGHLDRTLNHERLEHIEKQGVNPGIEHRVVPEGGGLGIGGRVPGQAADLGLFG